MLPKKFFLQCFGPNFWKQLKTTLVPFSDYPATPQDKEVFLDNLYNEIRSREYQPAIPRAYIISNKHNYVTRIVPAFSCKDYCAYLYCIKSLEEYLCDPDSRIPGTFGGWRLNHGLKQAEDEEISENEIICYYENNYGGDKSYNPLAWREHWKEFQSRVYEYGKMSKFSFALQFDIANFYDCISLNILENSVRSIVHNKGDNLNDEIELLFYFLTYWNRQFDGYRPRSVGIPQDEVQDCSRILANFYLREYDRFIFRFCLERDCQYLRYADDQLIYAPNREVALIILFEASKYLHKIGLNINSSKVHEFKDWQEFNSYWAFDIFNKLNDTDIKDELKLNAAVKMYFENKEKLRFRRVSVLNRLLIADFKLIKPEYRFKLFSELFCEEFLANCSYQYLKRIFNQCHEDQKKEFLKILDDLIGKVKFNAFHYNLRKFFLSNSISFDTEKINQKIRELSYCPE